MTEQEVLGLLRVDVHPSGQDEVGATVDDVEVAVLVEAAHVPDRRPSPLVARGGGLLRVVQILEWDRVLEIQVPDRSRRPLLTVRPADAGTTPQRPADRTGAPQPPL